MTLKIINVTVTEDAKRVLLDYQLKNNISHQGTALGKLLLEFKDVESVGKH